MRFPRQEYWSSLPFPSQRDLPDPGIKAASRALQEGFFTTEPLGKHMFVLLSTLYQFNYQAKQGPTKADEKLFFFPYMGMQATLPFSSSEDRCN